MIADRVKDTSTTTGTGNFTLSGTAPTGYQALAAIGAVGSTFGYVIDNGAEWEVGIGTITATNVFSRAPSASSNGGALVNFSAGTKSVYHSITAAQHSKYLSANAAAFSTTIPLLSPGATYMPQQTVSSVLAFTAAASPVQGALVYLRLIADGTNAPTFTGMKEWGGSLGYDNRNGIANQVQFFHDGVDAWFSISQAVGAVAADTLAPTQQGSIIVANSTPAIVSIPMSETLDPGNVPAASAFAVTGHTVSSVAISGSTVNLTCSAAFVNGEAARTVTYTAPGANGLRDSSGNQTVNFGPLSITNNVGAVATGAQLTGPTSGATSTASTAMTLTIIPTGANVTGTVRYTFNDTSGGGSFSPAFLDLSNGTPSGTTVYTPNATAGAKAITTTNNGGLSNPSLTYTTTAAATFTRLSQLSHVTESGTGPYAYTADTSTYAPLVAGPGGVATTSLAASADGSIACTLGAFGSGGDGNIMGFAAASTLRGFGQLDYGVYQNGGGGGFYKAITGGTIGAANVNSTTAPAVGDIMRMSRSGTTITIEVARSATPTTWIPIHSFTGAATTQLYVNVLASLGSVASNITGVGLT